MPGGNVRSRFFSILSATEQKRFLKEAEKNEARFLEEQNPTHESFGISKKTLNRLSKVL